MASDLSFVEFVVDQMREAGDITYRKMFGEYCLYCNKKVIGLICKNQLFIKPTTAGRTWIGDPVEAPAYPGAKPAFLIEDQIENREWLTHLIRQTESELPPPKPKKKKKGKQK